MDSTSSNFVADGGARVTTYLNEYGLPDDYLALPIDGETYMTCVFPVVPVDFYDADSTLEYCTICNVLASVA